MSRSLLKKIVARTMEVIYACMIIAVIVLFGHLIYLAVSHDATRMNLIDFGKSLAVIIGVVISVYGVIRLWTWSHTSDAD